MALSVVPTSTIIPTGPAFTTAVSPDSATADGHPAHAAARSSVVSLLPATSTVGLSMTFSASMTAVNRVCMLHKSPAHKVADAGQVRMHVAERK